MKIGKYEFKSKEHAQSKIKGLPINHNNAIVILGHLLIKAAVLDEDNQIIKEAKYSKLYALDVMWQNVTEHPYGWKTYAVGISTEGVHGFAGVSYLKNKI